MASAEVFCFCFLVVHQCEDKTNTGWTLTCHAFSITPKFAAALLNGKTKAAETLLQHVHHF